MGKMLQFKKYYQEVKIINEKQQYKKHLKKSNFWKLDTFLDTFS